MTCPRTLLYDTFCRVYEKCGIARVQECLAHASGHRFMTILLFHRITDAIPEDGLTVSTARFRRICRLLRDEFRVVPLAELHRQLLTREELPARTVAITFDDCYRDNLDAAAVLAEHRLPATFFLPTGYVGTTRVFPWDRHLPVMPNLSWADVNAMIELGFEIGSHSVDHPDLGRLPFREARRELIDSREELQQRLQRPIRWFAYPFGGQEHFHPGLLPIVEEAGYTACLSAHGGFVDAAVDPRLLPRLATPYFKSVRHLALHLRGCLGWVYQLKRVLGMHGEPGADLSPEFAPEAYGEMIGTAH